MSRGLYDTFQTQVNFLSFVYLTCLIFRHSYKQTPLLLFLFFFQLVSVLLFCKFIAFEQLLIRFVFHFKFEMVVMAMYTCWLSFQLNLIIFNSIKILICVSIVDILRFDIAFALVYHNDSYNKKMIIISYFTKS